MLKRSNRRYRYARSRQNTRAGGRDERSDAHNTRWIESLETRTLFSAILPDLPGLPSASSLSEQPAVSILREIEAPGISGVIQRTQSISLFDVARTIDTSEDTSANPQGTSLTANLGSFTININAGPTLASNADALAAFMRAAAQWEAFISDPISIEIDADLGTFSNDNIIGATNSVELFTDYSQIRNAMVADAAAEPDDQIVNVLPTYAQASFTTRPLHFIASGPTQSLSLSGTKANLKALGFDPIVLDDAAGTAFDATITFNQNFSFDYDDSDGITPGTMDFETVAAHEIGHALGFVSEVDIADFFYDSLALLSPRTLDMFRFADGVAGQDPDSATDFATFARNMVPGTEAVTDQVLNWTGSDPVEWAMSTGANNGDGRQASHWKDNGITGNLIGMLDPTLAFGQTFNITNADLRALDLIGYDIARPGTTTNQAPNADAGPDQTVNVDDTVNLDGSASSDPDGDPITSYAWVITSAPAGSSASLLGADTATPTFTPDLAGDYTIQLTVSDGSLTGSDTVVITANDTDPVPTETVTITKASYNAKKGELTIEATSSAGGDELLLASYIDGNGEERIVALEYNARKDKWTYKGSEPTQPAMVKVYFASDMSVFDEATVEGGGTGGGGNGGGGGGRPGNGKNIAADNILDRALASAWLDLSPFDLDDDA